VTFAARKIYTSWLLL